MGNDLLRTALSSEGLQDRDVEVVVVDAGVFGLDEAGGVGDLDGADVDEGTLGAAVVRPKLCPARGVDLGGPDELVLVNEELSLLDLVGDLLLPVGADALETERLSCLVRETVEVDRALVGGDLDGNGADLLLGHLLWQIVEYVDSADRHDGPGLELKARVADDAGLPYEHLGVGFD